MTSPFSPSHEYQVMLCHGNPMHYLEELSIWPKSLVREMWAHLKHEQAALAEERVLREQCQRANDGLVKEVGVSSKAAMDAKRAREAEAEQLQAVIGALRKQSADAYTVHQDKQKDAAMFMELCMKGIDADAAREAVKTYNEIRTKGLTPDK